MENSLLDPPGIAYRSARQVHGKGEFELLRSFVGLCLFVSLFIAGTALQFCIASSSVDAAFKICFFIENSDILSCLLFLGLTLRVVMIYENTKYMLECKGGGINHVFFDDQEI